MARSFLKTCSSSLLGASTLVSLYCSAAIAQVSDTAWVTVTSARTLIRNCSPVGLGENRVLLLNRGRRLQLLPLRNRSNEVKLAAIIGKENIPFAQAACVPNGTEGYSLFIRKDAVSVPIEVALTVDDFPIRGGSSENPDGGSNGGEVPAGSLRGACSNVKKWSSALIYKSVGSNHFTDVRRNTAGVIAKPGTRAPWPKCAAFVASNGSTIAKLGLYQIGGGWAARYYAGIGCGASTPYNGSKIASLARFKSGNSGVYIDFGATCFGPIDPTRCIGSSQC